MKKTILLFSALLIFGNLSAQDKAALVNPIIGTNGMGHTFPGACVPFGLVQLIRCTQDRSGRGVRLFRFASIESFA